MPTSNQIRLASLVELQTHTRFLTTLRSRARPSDYHSIIVFRLATSPRDLQSSQHDATFPEKNKYEASDSITTEAIPDMERYQIYAMESTCPHLGAELSHADIEESDTSIVAVCPWHRYDFDLKTGHSETGLRACTYAVEVRHESQIEGDTAGLAVWIESPGEGDWEVVELRPVSEAFADPPCNDLSNTPSAPGVPPQGPVALVDDTPEPRTLHEFAVLILNTPNAELKVQRTRKAVAAFRKGKLKSIGKISTSSKLAGPIGSPPDRPPREDLNMVQPGKVGKRGKAGSVKSRIAILHALANIEQWAVDLAWDIIARFGQTDTEGSPLPHQFFSDWIKVAEDEAKHFSLLRKRIEELGSFYGAHSVHAGLWDSAEETSGSLSARLAIIHLVHEARGLDVNPSTIAKFRVAGDLESVRVLEIIHHDEITHVTAGHRWFTWVCQKKGVDPVQTFRDEVRTHFHGALRGPFNEADRRKAGMTPDFYEDLRGEGGDEVVAPLAGRAGNVEIAYEK